jgi:hypothetical protein
MAFYKPKRKIPARAKRNFRRVAKKVVAYRKPRPALRRFQGDLNDSLKITMSRQIHRKDMNELSDKSMECNIVFNPVQDVSTTFSNGVANLLYHPSAAKLTEGIFRKYRCACVVLKISRPNVNFNYNNTNSNQTQNVTLPTIQWGTKILHSHIVNKPDSYTSAVQSNAVLTRQVVLIQPTSWNEAIDDGNRQFINHQYKRSCTRVWKPVGEFERRFVSVADDDLQLARGGIHIHMENQQPLSMDRSDKQWQYDPDVVLFDIHATVYMKYTDRT